MLGYPVEVRTYGGRRTLGGTPLLHLLQHCSVPSDPSCAIRVKSKKVQPQQAVLRQASDGTHPERRIKRLRVGSVYISRAHAEGTIKVNHRGNLFVYFGSSSLTFMQM